MSEIEKARKHLENCGYVHPTTLNTRPDPQYKVFNSKLKKDSYISAKNASKYAKLKTDVLRCPYCYEKAMYACD